MKAKTTYIILYVLVFFTPIQSLAFKVLGILPLDQATIFAIIYIAFGLLGLGIYRDSYAKSFRAFGKSPLQNLGQVFATYLYSAFVVAILAMVTRLPLSQNQDALQGLTSRLPLWLTLVALGICGPITEEIVYREWIFNEFKNRLPLWMVSVLSTLVFAGIHILAGDLQSLIFYLPLSASFVWIYTRKNGGGIFGSTLSHCLRNTISAVVLHFALQSLI